VSTWVGLAVTALVLRALMRADAAGTDPGTRGARGGDS